ncbi:MAG TPA: serine hydrolase domain-containing protein [Chthoniobacteraceae bacterium]|nr:serine hydrolase domain-containing protein [Chthoniobacteraceae bacterium]
MNTRALSDLIQPYIDRGELAGAVMFVGGKDGILAIEAAGWADIEARRPMAPDSLFWIASQSKPITAIAVMMLVEEGRLNLHDPVEKYLPEFKGLMYTAEKDDAVQILRRPVRPPSVLDLLIHTAGMPFKTLVEEPALDRLPLATAVRSYAMHPLDAEPGAASVYSNTGFNTAGRIVEVIADQPFEQFLAGRIFDPLGMSDTTFWPGIDPLRRLAECYRRSETDDGLVKIQIEQLSYPLDDVEKRFPFPAGGLFSTAADLVKLYRMMLNGGTVDGRTCLKPETVREMIRLHVPESWSRKQALGFVADGNSFSHGGAAGTSTLAHLDSGLILGWLVQCAGAIAEKAGAAARVAFEKAAIEQFSAK